MRLTAWRLSIAWQGAELEARDRRLELACSAVRPLPPLYAICCCTVYMTCSLPKHHTIVECRDAHGVSRDDGSVNSTEL